MAAPGEAASSLDDELAEHADGPVSLDDGPAQPMPSGDDAEACAKLIDRALSGIAVAARRQEAADLRFDGLVLNAAYLLNSDRAEEFAAVARALARTHEGLHADLTGPWPPYSFADLHQA